MNDAIIIDAEWHPLAHGHPPEWASGWGEDAYGVFVEITFAEVTQALRWCPPGRFLMGSPEDEAERFGEEGPLTEITFAHGFWLFDTPVTQALYEAVTGENRSAFRGVDRPVENVSWDDAWSFLRAINGTLPGLDLRLPSEAQWEYACRARSVKPFEPNVAHTHSGASIISDEANFDGNHPYHGAAVGGYRQETVGVKATSFQPNVWGIWQMHGNVHEWCEDVWQDGHEGASMEGLPRPASRQTDEALRVVRGGSWGSVAGGCRSAGRSRDAPDYRDDGLGFRPARNQASGAPAGSAEPPTAS